MRFIQGSNYFKLNLVLVIIFLAGCATSPKPYQTLGPTGPISVVGPSQSLVRHDTYHIVGPSETLWNISKTYGVDMQTLLQVRESA